MIHYGRISGLGIPWQFHFPDTKQYLRKFITGPEGTGPIAFTGKAVEVSEQEYLDWEKAGNTIDPFAEFCLLCEQTSEYMLEYDRCIFHAAALSFGGRSWLIAAGSGVGKSTICQSLMEKYPDEVTVINGDKPALQFTDDGGILVHPSPWNGKEGMHGAREAILAGIFLLRRGSENSIITAKESEAAVRVYINIFQSFQDEKVMKEAGVMADHMIRSAPVWLLTSKDVSETTHLVYRTMKEALS
ncbi:MAG: hypothetical protein IKF90_01030 [Parasporobacterium sp.]|nr:hypothetical protein [Parasporobacterium sp.]